MASEMNALIITAATLGVFHTLLGPNHYLPFVMITWAGKWSGLKMQRYSHAIIEQFVLQLAAL